jgi:hypothetical protein
VSTASKFRKAVDDRIAASGADVTDKTARLEAAREILTELHSTGDDAGLPSPEEYARALSPDAGATPGWQGQPRENYNITTKVGGLAGLRPREAVAKVFAERLNPTPTRTSADVHRIADTIAAEGKTPHYGSRAPQVAAVSRELSDIVSAEHGKRNRAPEALGEAWREATHRVMALSRQSREGILPRYGWR